MNRITRFLLPIGLLGLFGVSLQSSCISDPPALQLCGEIPSGGCPIGRGGTCDDATCHNLYDCVSGAWTRVTACHDAPTSSSSSTSGAGGAGGACVGLTLMSTTPSENPDCMIAGGCLIDPVTGAIETAGCAPPLQTPDCPAFAATSCSACEGCSDFFLCEKDPAGGVPPTLWVQIAFCDASDRPVLASKK